MYVVQASPFSKIFLPEWQQRCIEDATNIDRSEPGLFDVRVRRPAGGIVLSHMKPVHASTLIKRTGDREVEEDEITPLVYWLTGGPEQRPCEETDVYGIVMVEVGNSFERAMQDLMTLTLQSSDPKKTVAAGKDMAAIQRSVVKEMSEGLSSARKKADERVRRAVSITHTNLIKSWEALRSEGKGTYSPSAAEALGYHIIKADVDRRLDMNRKFYNSVAEGIPQAKQQQG